jgi:hypothetical protein
MRGSLRAIRELLKPEMSFNPLSGETVSLSALEDVVASVAFEDSVPDYLDNFRTLMY